MNNLVSTDLDSRNSYTVDELNMNSMTNLQHSNEDRHENNFDESGNENSLTGYNHGYADTHNTVDEIVSENTENDDTTVLDMDSDSSAKLEYDYNDSDSDASNRVEGDVYHDQQQESIDNTLDNNNDIYEIQRNDTEDDDTHPTWNTDSDREDDMNTAIVPSEEDAVEQGTVDDRLGSTLDQALEVLVNEEQSATTFTPLNDSMMINSRNSTIDSPTSSSLFGYHRPSSQHNSSSAIGYESIDDFAMIDFSYWLYGAIFVLICLRLPYVKRYFTRLRRQDIDSNTTLPYHNSQNKELD